MARNECTDAHHDLRFTSLRAKVGLMLFLVLLYMLILIFLTNLTERMEKMVVVMVEHLFCRL